MLLKSSRSTESLWLAERRVPAGSLLGQVVEYLARAGLLIPCVALFLGLGNMALLNLSPRGDVLLVLFSATYLVYFLDRHMPFSPEDRLDRPQVGIGEQLWFGCIVLSGLVALLQMHWASILLVACLGLLSVGYVFPVLPGKRRVKDVPFAKLFVVAIGWVLGGILLPALESGVELSMSLVWLCLYRLVYLAPNLLLSDWPDRQADQRHGIRTWAMIVTESSMIVVCRWLLGGTGMIGLLGLYLDWLPALVWVDLFGLTFFLLVLRRPLPTSKYPFQIHLDVLMAWPLVTWVVWRMFPSA